jgi:hypothetical protein
MTFQVAKREAVPMMLALAGTSGSGKTYSALLVAAGIAGESGKVGFIDTEAGRGSMYADDPDIIAAMPGGQYYIQRLTEPFTPDKYTKAIKEAIAAGITVLVVDSASHEWEGFGGCQDIAENNKLRGMPNWAKAKMEHKKLMNSLTQCPMHIVFCLRAREKTKPVKGSDGKVEMVQMGMQPIQEKNFMYEMTLSMLLEDSAPGKPIITKCPKPLLHLFTGEQAIITKDIGEKLKAWADGGASVDMVLRNLKRECREAAMFGSERLDKFFKDMDKSDKALLAKLTDAEFQTEVRSLATEADAVNSEGNDEEQPTKLFNE